MDLLRPDLVAQCYSIGNMVIGALDYDYVFVDRAEYKRLTAPDTGETQQEAEQ
jgi:hypothetical protein